MSLDATIDHAARECIRAALVAASGNVRAAAALSRHPSTLHRQIDRLGLRAWLTESYDRTDRQQNRTSARPQNRTAPTRTTGAA